MSNLLKRISFLLFSFAMGVTANAQTNELVQSFMAIAPDTVVQTQPFTVTYTLKATTWEKGIDETPVGNGFRMIESSYSVESAGAQHILKTSVTYVTSRVGLVELPALTIEVKKQKVVSAPRSIYVKPHPDYGKELTFAHEWLLKKGQHPDSLCLSMAADDEGFWLFHDRPNHCFCLIAKAEAWPCVGQPVLAYSTESAISGFSDKNYNRIVSPYRQQIATLMKKGKGTVLPKRLPYTPKNKSVSPLLKRLQWGQLEPFNRYSPTFEGKKGITGCVPLAVAMVMNFHQWPEQGHSQVYYQDGDKTGRVDFMQYTPEWKTFRNVYQENDTAEAAGLSKLLYALGVSLDANYGTGSTSASLSKVKHVICNNLGYSGKASLYNKQLTDHEMQAYLYQELDQQRPCIVSNEVHAFVCDGYEGEFLHYNMGWNGYYNGYYRLSLKDEDENPFSSAILIKSVLGGIQPRRKEMPEKMVSLKKAGSLASQLSDEEKENLTRLTIKGVINGADVKLLRKMAGAPGDSPFTSWHGGSLRELNLEEAMFVADDQPYLTRKATGTFQTVSYKKSASGDILDQKVVNFNLDAMTETEWNDFKNTAGVKFEGWFYTRTDNNICWKNYTTSDHTIGQYMFADCSSLNHIVLPAKTESIDSYAFLSCSSLQRIHIPKTIKNMGEAPFSYCVSLEEIELPKGFDPQSPIYEKCSPILQEIKRY